MHPINYSQKRIRHITRWLLVVFVLSWLNLAFQAPVHASMMQSRQMSSQMDMVDCHCPPAVCDSVVSLDSQSVDGVYVSNLIPLDFQLAYVLPVGLDIVHQHEQHYFSLADVFSRSYSPPPLALTGILLI